MAWEGRLVYSTPLSYARADIRHAGYFCCLDCAKSKHSSSSFWHPVFHASKLAEHRRVIAYDFDGHGHKSDFSGQMSIASLVQDLKDVLDGLSIKKAVLLVHSMSGVSKQLYTRSLTSITYVIDAPFRTCNSSSDLSSQKRTQTESRNSSYSIQSATSLLQEDKACVTVQH